jgi:hypothetical protein
MGAPLRFQNQGRASVTDSPLAPRTQPAPEIDTTVPHPARIWNYWLPPEADAFCAAGRKPSSR